MSLLEDLYNGNLYPSEHIVPQDKNYRLFSREAGNIREYFYQKISTEDKEKMKRLDQLTQDIHNMECYENFAGGFRLGVRFLLDALMESRPTEK